MQQTESRTQDCNMSEAEGNKETSPASEVAAEGQATAKEVLQSTEHQLQSAGDQVGQATQDGLAFIRDSANGTQQALEEGLSAASGALKNGAVNARLQYKKAYQRTQATPHLMSPLAAPIKIWWRVEILPSTTSQGTPSYPQDKHVIVVIESNKDY